MLSGSGMQASLIPVTGGVDDWRVLSWGAYAYYRIGSFAQGVRFVAAIADVAEETGHYPDVDLRPEGVTVRTFSRQDGALSERDIALARRISDMAGELGLEPDPSQVQMVGIAVAQDAGADVRPFWSAALGYEYLGAEDAIDRHRRNPHLWFHALNPSKAGRGRFHIDVAVPADQAESRVAAAWRRAAVSPTTRGRRSGGRLLPLRTTASTSRPGPTSRTTTKSDLEEP